MKGFLLVVMLAPSLANAGGLYKCQGQDGGMSFQDMPCDTGAATVGAPEEKRPAQELTNEMLHALARLAGKSEEELNDPELRKAAEALASTDAAKSYAFTQIYDVSSRYCGTAVTEELSNYRKKAAEVISLGKYYYTNGIHVELKGKVISKSGKELTDGLNKLISDLETEHKIANPVALEKKCSEASSALKNLAMAYGG